MPSQMLISSQAIANPHILLIHPDFELAQSMQRALDCEGYRVMIAQDGITGLTAIRDRRCLKPREVWLQPHSTASFTCLAANSGFQSGRFLPKVGYTTRKPTFGRHCRPCQRHDMDWAHRQLATESLCLVAELEQAEMQQQ
jgi:hypothetical protein